MAEVIIDSVKRYQPYCVEHNQFKDISSGIYSFHHGSNTAGIAVVWCFASLSMLHLVYGAHTIEEYSRIGLMYIWCNVAN